MASMENRDGIIGDTKDSLTGRRELVTADWLAGVSVVNEAGEQIGEIAHIMLDVSKGTIAYAVLAFGGFLGMGDKLFAVPWHSLAFDMKDKFFVMNVDKERLKAAPGFDKNHWPSLADPKFAQEVHAYYGPPSSARSA